MKRLMIAILTIMGLIALGPITDVYAEETYTITFNSNGGSAIDAITVESGKEVIEVIEGKIPTPTKEGMAFAGWYLESTFENQFKFYSTLESDVELYAKWLLPIDEISISGITKPEMGTKAGDNIASIKKDDNSNYEIGSIKWWISEDGMYYTSTATDYYEFENDKYYEYQIELKAKDGYEFSMDEYGMFTGNISISNMKYNSVQQGEPGTLLIVGNAFLLVENDTATYEITEGANQTYTIGESTEARFTVDANQKAFEGHIVYIDNEEFNWEEFQYELEETTIIFPKEYMDTLEEGSHTLKFVFVNDKTSETTFTVSKKSEVEPEPTQEYEVVEGDKQTYTTDKDEAEFRINADYSLFKDGGKVYVDDKLVSEENYTSKEGSTIVTFKKAFLDTLSNGVHTLKVIFNNSKEATASFTVTKEEKTEETKTEETNKTTTNPTPTTTTKPNNNKPVKSNTIKAPHTDIKVSTNNNISLVPLFIFACSILGILLTIIMPIKEELKNREY
ncbi:MAG: InlB B-repeat-containing protein [Bacilli bacterium]|nr:InlB B-repeat-containing protein [Bacilli bacterium]